jgi:uncharacterized protein (DUF4415 family)
MAKKSSVSSQPERRIRLDSKDIFGKPLTKRQQAVVERLAARQAAGDDSHINFSDIPELSEEQLNQMTRLRDRKPKISVSVRLDVSVLDWLKSKGAGHLTRINDILANVMALEAKRRSG